MANDIFPGAIYKQLAQWGFPTHALRTPPPPGKAFSVIHWTAALTTAEAEVDRRSDGNLDRNNATFWVNRGGSVVQALGDPLGMAPWTNGDMQVPDVSNLRIATLVNEGLNANFRSLVTIENTGTYGYEITPEQEDTNAAIIAYYHAKAGLPISRDTVIGHYQINSINRPHCPGTDKAVIDRIVSKAQGEDAMKLLGTPITPLQNKKVMVRKGTTFVKDPSRSDVGANDNSILLAGGHGFPADNVFVPDWKVLGTTVAGSPNYYHGMDPAWNTYGFGYIPEAGLIPFSDGSLTAPIEVIGPPSGYTQDQLDRAKAGAATAVANAAVAKAEEF